MEGLHALSLKLEDVEVEVAEGLAVGEVFSEGGDVVLELLFGEGFGLAEQAGELGAGELAAVLGVH